MLAGVSRSRATEPVAVYGRAMGTTWSAKWLPGSPAVDPETVRTELAARLEQLENIFSTYRPESELCRFNRSETTHWIPVSAELAAAADRARRISTLTGGAFDVTVEPLLQRWGFGPHPAPARAPDDAELTALRSRVDWRRLETRVQPPALRKTRPDAAVDFSSVAKGLAVDALGVMLVQLGCSNHLIAIGGDLRAAGPGPRGDGWPVGIEDPFSTRPALARTVLLRDRALSTSGNHRNVRIIAGQRVGHVIDPRTGRPVAGPLISTSVVAPTCAESSALATGLFVLGAEAGEALVQREGIAALFLSEKGGRIAAQESPAFTRLTTAPAQTR
ncbi:MAG: FAD:protein FMN transferase [Opitutaceae bacterium]